MTNQTQIQNKSENSKIYWENLIKTVKENNNINFKIDFIKYPVITAKTLISLYTNRQYTFDVDRRLTKTEIKKLFEKIFNVNIVAITTHIPPKKKIRVGYTQGYRPQYKRTIITVKEGQFLNYNLNKK